MLHVINSSKWLKRALGTVQQPQKSIYLCTEHQHKQNKFEMLTEALKGGLSQSFLFGQNRSHLTAAQLETFIKMTGLYRNIQGHLREQETVLWGWALQTSLQGPRLRNSYRLLGATRSLISSFPHSPSPALADGLLCLLISVDIVENGCFSLLLRGFSSQAIIGLHFLHLLVQVLGTRTQLCVSFIQETHAWLEQMPAVPCLFTSSVHVGCISKCQFLHLFVWGLLWPGCHCALADETGQKGLV